RHARDMYHHAPLRLWGGRAEVLEKRAPIERHYAPDVRWAIANGAGDLLDELLHARMAESAVVATLDADRRGGLVGDLRAATEGAAKMPRPHLDVVVEAQPPVVARGEDRRRPVPRLDREVGPGDVPHGAGVA